MTKPARTMRRPFVTPEGVDLGLDLASAGTRAAAFLIDFTAVILILIATALAIAKTMSAARSDALVILWLLGAFALRNGWFILFETGGRGATPGKRVLGIRVVAQDGARLTGGAVIARNAMREVEIFLPLTFLGFQAADGTADAFLAIFALAWSGIFLFFPLFNRDRLRMGDIVAGTWVVRAVGTTLGSDLGATRAHRTFSEAALDLYGEYELQMLEDVLRTARPDAVATVAATIRAKAQIAPDGDDIGFLREYYAALCARLERRMAVGRRRADKCAGR